MQLNLSTSNRTQRPARFPVRLPIEDALGSDYRVKVEGLRRIEGTGTVVDLDFDGGSVTGVFVVGTDDVVRLLTLYPDGR